MIPDLLRSWAAGLPDYGGTLRGPYGIRPSATWTVATNGAATLGVCGDFGCDPTDAETEARLSAALFGGDTSRFTLRYEYADSVERSVLASAAAAAHQQQPGRHPRGYVAGILVCLDTLACTVGAMERLESEMGGWAATSVPLSVGVFQPKEGGRPWYGFLHLTSAYCRATLAARLDHDRTLPRIGDARAIMRASMRSGSQ